MMELHLTVDKGTSLAKTQLTTISFTLWAALRETVIIVVLDDLLNASKISSLSRSPEGYIAMYSWNSFSCFSVVAMQEKVGAETTDASAIMMRSYLINGKLILR